MLESDIYNRLVDQIGTAVGNRIYPIQATENTQLPFLIYDVALGESIWTMPLGPSGEYPCTVTICVVAIDLPTLIPIAGDVIQSLDGFNNSGSIVQLQLTDSEYVANELSWFHYSIRFTGFTKVAGWFTLEGSQEYLMLETGEHLTQ